MKLVVKFGYRSGTGKGFSLVEIILALAILVFIAALVLSRLSLFRQSAEINRAVSETLGLLREARSKTLGSENSVEYGIHFASTTITLFRGITYNSADLSNIVHNLPGSVVISGLALSTTTNNIVFERLSGRSPASGTVTFSSTGSSGTRSIYITSSGLFDKL